MGSPTSVPLSEEDARILALEQGNVRGHTCKVVVVEGHHSVDDLRARLAARLPHAPQLRRRLEVPSHHGATPVWVEHEGFDAAEHVRLVATGGPIAAGQLPAMVGPLMATPLDRGRPLWQMDVVHQADPDVTALVWRVHHCLADGLTVMHLADAVLWDDGPAGPGPVLPQRQTDLASTVDAHASPPDPVLEPPEPDGHHPLHQFARLLPVLRREMGPVHARSALGRHVGPQREVAFASLPLARAKDLAHAAGPGVTVNDVVLSVVGGGLRTWSKLIDSPAAGLRAQVPVSLHHHDPTSEMAANHDSFMFVDLDVEEADPVERLLAVSRQTRERKQSHDAEALDAFLRDLGRVSRHLQDLALRWTMSPRHFAVNVSNVPGPNRPLSVLGGPVLSVYSLAEVADRHALRVAVISAGGSLSFGLCGDPDVVQGIDVLARGIESEIERLGAEVAV